MIAREEDAEPGISGPGTPVLTRVQRAHEKIVELLSELEQSDPPRPAPEVLDELAGILPGHFADEEGADGLFEQLRIQRPEIESRLKFVQWEHRSIVQALEALQAKVREAGRDPARIEGEKAAFVRKLRSHEHGENLLVLDVYLEDEGGSG